MKLTTLLLLAGILQVQANGMAQNITHTANDVPLKEVFAAIKQQTGFSVFYYGPDVAENRLVSVNWKNLPVATALEKLLAGQNLSFIIRGRTIFIKKKSEEREELNWTEFSPITGVVRGPDGLPLGGVNVVVKGSKMGTVTDASGTFSISASIGDVLIISYIGYEEQEVKIASGEVIIVSLVRKETKMEEVIINAGYYNVKKKEATGSISRVDAKTIANQPVSNPLSALIGRMPGVNVSQNSGIAGGNISIEIRGRNSLRPDARDPLYLVDGVPYPSAPLTNNSMGVSILAGSNPLNILNPFDIESIEVLKDADATAIYGSRGANGVVLIKTKLAKSGKTSVDINVYTGISKVGSKLKLLNTPQYLEMRNEAFKNDGINPGLTDYDINGTWDKQRYTDWQDVFIGGTAQLTNISASINGGNEFTQIAFRSNYSKQSTVFPGDFADEKGSGSLTANHASLNKKFKVNFSSSYLLDNNNLPRADLTNNIFLPPNAPELYSTNGDLNWAYDTNGASTWVNPLAVTRNVYTGKSNTFISSAVVSYELISGLILKTNLGYTNIRLSESLLNSVTAGNPSTAPLGSNYLSNNIIETSVIEPQVTYSRGLFNGNVEILLGSTFQKDDQKRETIIGTGYTNDLLLNSITSAPTKTGTSSSTQYKYNALFARINYNYQSKYIINLTARRDGSSRFGPGRQFGNFGAVGAAWIFWEEKSFKSKFPFFSFGKLRASYGITGSDKIGDYAYLDTYSASQPYQGGSGLTPTRLANPDYAWENNKKLEAALDLGILQDKIYFTASWYRNRSSNQLVGYSLADITGFTSIQYNLPATVQNTGLEFELNTTNISSKIFTWKTAFNLTIPRSKLLSYPNIAGSAYASTYTVDQSLYTPIGYHYLGVNPQTGLYTFADLNGNGNDLDEADKRTTGRALESHAFGGLQNSFIYKNFQLDVFFQLVSKTAKDPLTQYNIPGSIGNQSVRVMERWRNQGDETSIQKFTQSLIAGGPGFRFFYTSSSDYYTDASFIRLKNVSFSWNAPAKWVQQIKLNNLKLYLQGQNLFTITKFKGDPEVSIIKTLPTLTTITAGIQVNL